MTFDTQATPAVDLEPIVAPNWGTLTALVEGCDTLDGIAIQSLAPGTTLTICTRNSTYRVVVIDGVEQLVRVQGGSLLPEATEACLDGATVGGCLLKSGWIGRGLRAEFSVGPRRIITSHVQSITVDPE